MWYVQRFSQSGAVKLRFVRIPFQLAFSISRGALAPGFGDELSHEPDASASRLMFSDKAN